MGFLGCDITNARCLLSVTIGKPPPKGKAATIIGADQFGEVLGTGVGSIAVVRALVNAPNPEKAARQLMARMATT